MGPASRRPSISVEWVEWRRTGRTRVETEKGTILMPVLKPT